jgi:hypothetical protein
MQSCEHNTGFYESGEGLMRCNGCSKSYDYIRAEEERAHFNPSSMVCTTQQAEDGFGRFLMWAAIIISVGVFAWAMLS